MIFLAGCAVGVVLGIVLAALVSANGGNDDC